MSAMKNSTYRTWDAAVQGGALRVGEWGINDGDAPLVLAVHGVTASHLAWAVLAEKLPGVRLIAPDLRGRGRSSGLPGPWGMAQHADDLAQVLRAAGADESRPAVVVGHSMGAFVSLVLADRFPELVGRLLLIDGGIPLEAPPGLTADEALAAVLGPAAERLRMEFPSPEAYLDYWRPHPALGPHWSPEIEEYLLYDLQGEAPQLRPATSLEAVAHDNRDLFGGSAVRAALGRLPRPTHLVRAQRGLLDQVPPLCPDDAVAHALVRFPQLRVTDIPDTNHYSVVMDHPGASAVAAHIGGLVSEVGRVSTR
ncbi:alpha/beta fold hydrolase [Sinomonas sp.]|uniref:alpha/beta fold hydrolase n=1 Tax=Sinomonas sp. TaxID=1914986 RepID=UPI002FE1DE57